MNATEQDPVIDQERLAITARSATANLDVLTEEGLSDDATARAREHAETLVDESLDPTEARRHATSLRELLATASGPTSVVLVAWLDDALAPTD